LRCTAFAFDLLEIGPLGLHSNSNDPHVNRHNTTGTAA